MFFIVAIFLKYIIVNIRGLLIFRMELMRKNSFLLLLSFALIQIGFCKGVQIVPVKPSAQPENVRITVALPEKAAVENNLEWLQVRIKGFSLGSTSPLFRRKEIASSMHAQSLRIVIDNMPAFAFDGLSIDPLEESGDYNEALYKIKLPQNLQQGLHVLRIFPCRSFGEGLHQKGNFVSTYFYVAKRQGDNSFLQKPYLTYNEPTGKIITKSRPILLDFYVENCELSTDGYKVEVTIDDHIKQKLNSLGPYYIYGLSQANHFIRLRLVDKNDRYVEGPFNDVIRKITIL